MLGRRAGASERGFSVVASCVTGLLEMSGQATNLVLYPELIARLGRRRQVLERMWAGRCTKEIAADLGISPKTVEYHRAQLYRMFKVNNPVTLCRRGLRAGVIQLEDPS
jgi:FixJ family two-component response regulator